MNHIASRGFTLLEVLVAVAVIAVAFTGILGVVGQAADSAGSLRDRTYAMWLAQNRLVQHQLEKDWPSISTKTGTSDFAGDEWQWEEQIQSSQHQDIRRIEILVRKKDADHVLATLIGILRKPQSNTIGAT